MEKEYKNWMEQIHDRGELKEFDYLPQASSGQEWKISILVIECQFGEVERFHVEITRGLNIQYIVLNQFELNQMVKSDFAIVNNVKQRNSESRNK